MSEKLVLIDLSGIAHPLWHVNDGNSNPNATSIAIVERIRAMASAHRHVAICCDSGKSFRADIDPTYKAQRPESDARLMHQIGLAVETLRGDGFPIWAAKGFEADDVIATAVRNVGVILEDVKTGEKNGFSYALIISPDKDLRQLVSDRVEVLAPSIADRPAKTYDSEAVFLRHGVQPHQLLDFFALVGDASDNIKGADGIGEKKAAAMLAKFGNMEDLYAALSKDLLAFTPSTRKALIDFGPRMDMVRELIRLRTDAPIPFEEIFRERVPQDVAVFSEGDDVDDIDYAMQTLGEHEHKTNDSDATESPEIEPGRTQALPLGSDTSHQGSESGNLKTLPPVQQGMERAGAKDLQTARQSLVVSTAPVEWERGLEPRDMNDAVKLADRLMASRLFSAYGHPAGILATVLAGREFGMQAMTSLRAFHIIEGKPTLSAGAIVAIVMKSGKAEYFRPLERTSDRATFATKRHGDPEVVMTFTLDEAKQAWSKDPASFGKSAWGKHPADMCVARCSSKLARLVYPDVVFNLYAPEEFEA